MCQCPFAWPAGLYGKHLPITVSNFRSAVQQGLYTGTIFHKVLPGAFVQVCCRSVFNPSRQVMLGGMHLKWTSMQECATLAASKHAYISTQAGRQGSKRQGEVFVPKDSQQPNPELLQGASYRLPHMRPGEPSDPTLPNL